MMYAAFAAGSDAPVCVGRERKVFQAAVRAAGRGRRGVTVHDQDGGVFAPDGSSATCPDCRRGDGQHRPGPPHCRRRADY